MYNGGDKVTPPRVSPVNINWKSYHISSGDLWIQDTTNPNLGLQYGSLNDTSIVIRLPRSHSLEISKDSRDLCNAIRCCVKAQRKSVKCGSKLEVFAHTATNEYMCVGTQACQAEKGLNCGYHRIKKGFTNEHWDILFKTLKKGEHAFDAYSPTDVICHVHEAKKLKGYQTMKSSPTSESIKESCRFNGIVFGINVFLCCHRDLDFTLSIVQVKYPT